MSREEFDAVWIVLESSGLPMRADRAAAWVAFSGWRVNYDTVLLELCALTSAPTHPWSGDRAPPFQRPPLLRRSSVRHVVRGAVKD